MRKLYSMLAVMVLGMLGFTALADDITITLKLDDASHYVLENNNYQSVDLVDGDNVLTGPEYAYYTLRVLDDYYLTSVTVNGEAERLYNRTSYSIYFGQAFENAVIEVASASLAEGRTAKCTVVTDDPEAVHIYFQADYFAPELTGETTEVYFIPDVEKDWVVYNYDYAEFYKVTLNGVEIEYSYNQYNVYDVTDGSTLEIITKFPEKAVPVHFDLTAEMAGLVTGVTVNNVMVNNFMDADFTVNSGSRLAIYTDPNWDVNGITVNGDAQYYYAGMTFVIKEETTFGFAATKKETYPAKVIVDDPRAVNLYLGGSFGALPTKLHEGVNNVLVSNYLSIQFVANDDYVITEATCIKGNGSREPIYVSAFHEATDTYDSAYGECTYSVKTAKLADLRTAHATINIDKPQEVMVYMLFGTLKLNEGTNEITFAPGIEDELTVAPVDFGQSIYKVTLNGTAVADEWGQYHLTIADGDVVDITVAYPEGAAAVNFEFADEASKEFVTMVTVDGEPVTDYDQPGYELPLGSRLEIAGNTAGYKLDAFEINGENVADRFYSSYSMVIDGETNIFIKAHKYADVTFRIDVNNAAAVKVYVGQPYDPTYIDLQDGANTVAVSETFTELNIAANDGYTISGVYANGEEVFEGWSGYTVNIAEGMEVVIAADKINYDQKAVVYSDCAEPYSFAMDASNRTSPIDSNDGKYTVGYNTVEFFGNMNPFSLRCYWSGDELAYVYLNNENISSQAGYRVAGGLSLDDLNLANGDVLKVYTMGEPTMCNVTFAGNVEGATIVTDRITPVSGPSIEALTGTEIEISEAEGAQLKGVTVNGAELSPIEGVFYVTVEGDDLVEIIAETTAISSVSADLKATGNVYNTQGMLIMRGANAAQIQSLPAGLYIIDGKKVMKR